MRASRSLFPLACVVALSLGASAAYTVRPGDTLSSIAHRLRVSVDDLFAPAVREMGAVAYA